MLENLNDMKSEHMLKSFSEYCYAHPELRFWQALRNWTAENVDADVNYILVAPAQYLDVGSDEEAIQLLRDTFYWEDEKLGPARDRHEGEDIVGDTV